MDPLSDVLSLLQVKSYMFGGFEVGGPWSVSYGEHKGIKCYGITSGACFLAVEGAGAPVRLVEGDLFILPRGLPFRLATDLDLEPVDFREFLQRPADGGVVMINGGGDFGMIGGHFAITGGSAGMLIDVLPPIVHINRQDDREAFLWSIARMRHELAEPRPGSYLMGEHMAHMLLLQALRAYLEGNEHRDAGWLSALTDPQIGAAISAIHAEPSRRWTLAGLAQQAGMSRSSFAERFRRLVGSTPMDYLTRWRMLLAADRLKSAKEPVGRIALSLGYESEAAFSTAFKRVMGTSPRQHGDKAA
ncbi:AraC family transcriptional regulator [Martelella alba]|uniref:AraC family transcriptional regulator n=1 Tax=Martelella alba TaxID=2590451 RepID=A0A506U5V3_9HYPH|nr:AraC family transcriptional regulator [Martelella alba]TPW28464.1 AraC family transcriptional regulator [Martelella alba]